jgi:hypothetical protein
MTGTDMHMGGGGKDASLGIIREPPKGTNFFCEGNPVGATGGGPKL